MQNLKQQLIFGRHPILEALENNQVDKILILKDSKGAIIDQIKAEAKKSMVPVRLITEEVLRKILFKNRIQHEVQHQGILAWTALVTYYQIEDVLPQIYEIAEVPLILILDGITDVGNLGAIARSAWCMGAHAIVMAHNHSAQINADAVKSSAGAILKINVCRTFSLRRSVEYLKYNGIKIFAAHAESGIPAGLLNLKEPSAIILGSEGEGISKELLEKADQQIKIPMKQDFDSLNVSVSAGILLYEAYKQRNRI